MTPGYGVMISTGISIGRAGGFVEGADQSRHLPFEIDLWAVAHQPKGHREMGRMGPFWLRQGTVEKFAARARDLMVAGKLPPLHRGKIANIPARGTGEIGTPSSHKAHGCNDRDVLSGECPRPGHLLLHRANAFADRRPAAFATHP
jgi:hypothetical protein